MERGYDEGKTYKAEQYAKFSDGIGAVPIERDPDSIESLIAQVYSQALDNKDALGNIRHVLLGPWPEAATDALNKVVPTNGLVAQLRETLYKIMDDQRTMREHIVAISKGVR